jgi:hypothetical protein
MFSLLNGLTFMNINHLLEIIEPKISQARYKGSFQTSPTADDDFSSDINSRRVGSEKNVLGKGHYSTVSKDKTDPHMVKKHNIRFDDEGLDTYDQFAQYIINNKLYENPYFPKIYQHKTIVDKNENPLHKFQIEKLEEVTNLSIEEIEHIYRIIFKKPESQKKMADKKYKGFMKHVKKRLLAQITSQMRAAIEFNNPTDFKDSNIVEAIRELHNFLSKECKECELDLHPGNIMARRTPYGVQLVITDPVSHGYSY